MKNDGKRNTQHHFVEKTSITDRVWSAFETDLLSIICFELIMSAVFGRFAADRWFFLMGFRGRFALSPPPSPRPPWFSFRLLNRIVIDNKFFTVHISIIRSEVIQCHRADRRCLATRLGSAQIFKSDLIIHFAAVVHFARHVSRSRIPIWACPVFCLTDPRRIGNSSLRGWKCGATSPTGRIYPR